MAENETLIQKFAKKHFTDSPAHMMRSINVGKFLFGYFMPGEPVPESPATLLNFTRTALLANERELSDEDFVRLVLNQMSTDPSLVTFDMVADLLESDAYKNFGHTPEDGLLKNQFEDWLVNNSMLAHIDSVPAVDVVLNQDGIQRTAAALGHGSLLQHAEHINYINEQIDNKVKEFDETFVQNAPENALEELKGIAADDKQNYVDKIKNVYGVLCDKEHADFLKDNLDAITMGAKDSQARNAMIVGAGMTANKVLMAVAQRKGWDKSEFIQTYLQTPTEKRAGKLEEVANQKAGKPNVKKVNPVMDVVKTFGVTLGGATAISAITSIPGVGSVVGPILGAAGVVTAGISTGLANYRKAKQEAKAKGEELKKLDAAKIALKTGIAMMGKAAPYAMAMALGPGYRAVGAALVMAKTVFNDLERRANLQREQVEQLEAAAQNVQQPKGIRARLKNFIDRVKNIKDNVTLSDVAKSAAYGAAKGAAVFMGGQMGREVGTAIGSNVNVDLKHGVTWNSDKIKNDLSETKLGKFAGLFNREHGTVNDANVHLATAGASVQLSDENMARLHQIGRVELTDNARATAYVENHRQYIGGEQHDWYNAEQERMAVQTLQKAGVDDPYGVLRKVGSASRFFGGEYKATLDNLCRGSISDRDVNQIFGALEQINEQGGLGRINTMTTNFIDTHAQVESVSEPVTENTTDFIHHDFEGGATGETGTATQWGAHVAPFSEVSVSDEVENNTQPTEFIHHDYNGGIKQDGVTPFINSHEQNDQKSFTNLGYENIDENRYEITQGNRTTTVIDTNHDGVLDNGDQYTYAEKFVEPNHKQLDAVHESQAEIAAHEQSLHNAANQANEAGMRRTEYELSKGAAVEENLNTEEVTSHFPFGHHDSEMTLEPEVEPVVEPVTPTPDNTEEQSQFGLNLFQDFPDLGLDNSVDSEPIEITVEPENENAFTVNAEDNELPDGIKDYVNQQNQTLEIDNLIER